MFWPLLEHELEIFLLEGELGSSCADWEPASCYINAEIASVHAWHGEMKLSYWVAPGTLEAVVCLLQERWRAARSHSSG